MSKSLQLVLRWSSRMSGQHMHIVVHQHFSNTVGYATFFQTYWSGQCVHGIVCKPFNNIVLHNIVPYLLGCRQVSHQVQSLHLYHPACTQTWKRQNCRVPRVIICDSNHIAQQVSLQTADNLMSTAMTWPDARERDSQSSYILKQ